MKHTAVVEGVIGVGKSTFGHQLAEELLGLFLSEPDEAGNASCLFYAGGCVPFEDATSFVNPYLDDYYEDAKATALKMQMHLLGLRARIHELATSWADCGLTHVVIDRSVYGDIAFAYLQYQLGHLTPAELTTYRALHLHMMSHIRYPRVCVLLDIEPQNALERIHARAAARPGRRSEKAITIGYQTRLREEIEGVVRALEQHGTHIIRIDWNPPRGEEKRKVVARQVAAEIAELNAHHEFADDRYLRRK